MDTTLYMHSSTLQLLNSGAKDRGCSRAALVKAALFRFSEGVCEAEELGSSVAYQDSDLPGNWRKFHIVFSQEEYNFVLSLRIFFKMSLSLIVATALRNFLEELPEPELIREVLDNSPVEEFRFRGEKVPEGKIFEIWWIEAGKPPD